MCAFVLTKISLTDRSGSCHGQFALRSGTICLGSQRLSLCQVDLVTYTTYAYQVLACGIIRIITCCSIQSLLPSLLADLHKLHTQPLLTRAAMVWPFGGKKESEEQVPMETPSLQSLTKPQTQASAPQDDPYASDPILSQMPRPSSVFEFGQTVSAGQGYMRGVCTGENPDAIQACTWSIEVAPQPAKPKEKKSTYRIEF